MDPGYGSLLTGFRALCGSLCSVEANWGTTGSCLSWALVGLRGCRWLLIYPTKMLDELKFMQLYGDKNSRTENMPKTIVFGIFSFLVLEGLLRGALGIAGGIFFRTVGAFLVGKMCGLGLSGRIPYGVATCCPTTADKYQLNAGRNFGILRCILRSHGSDHSFRRSVTNNLSWISF